MKNRSLKIIVLGSALFAGQYVYSMASQAARFGRSCATRVGQLRPATIRQQTPTVTKRSFGGAAVFEKPVYPTMLVPGEKITLKQAEELATQALETRSIEALEAADQKLFDVMRAKKSKGASEAEVEKFDNLWRKVYRVKDAVEILKRNPGIANITLERAEEIAAFALKNPIALRFTEGFLDDLLKVKLGSPNVSKDEAMKFLYPLAEVRQAYNAYKAAQFSKPSTPTKFGLGTKFNGATGQKTSRPIEDTVD